MSVLMTAMVLSLTAFAQSYESSAERDFRSGLSVTESSLNDSQSRNKDWNRKLTIKTNIAGLALLIGNAAVEVDLSRHLSFNLPVYYSALDYFKPTVKFRTLAVQPELRWNFGRTDCTSAHISAWRTSISPQAESTVSRHLTATSRSSEEV